MNVYDLVKHFQYVVLVFVLFISGCATSSMQMSSEEIKQVTPNEGIVVGSILITGGEDHDFILTAKNINDTAIMKSWFQNNIIDNPFKVEHEFTIQASDKKETAFVTKMPVGVYKFLYFTRLKTLAQYSLRINIWFAAKPNQATYIGRLIVEIPKTEKLGLLPLPKGPPRFSVEDAKVSVLDAVDKKTGLSGNELTTELMRIRSF